MKIESKTVWRAVICLFMLFSINNLNAQDIKNPTETSGCKPSSCRGAQTKFGEAKVITDVRESLISLKANMENSEKQAFDSRSYDVHDIVGETDEESLSIIVKEVRLIETDFAEKFKRQFTDFQLPDNKAKQVKYLTSRIQELQRLL